MMPHMNHSMIQQMSMHLPTTSYMTPTPQRSSSIMDKTTSPKVGKEVKSKVKVSRERQLKINAASRKCRKKQKLELHFLRAHVLEIRKSMYEHGRQCPLMDMSILEQSQQQIEDLTTIRIDKDLISDCYDGKSEGESHQHQHQPQPSPLGKDNVRFQFHHTLIDLNKFTNCSL